MSKAKFDQFNVKFKNDVNKRLDSVSDAANLVKSEVSCTSTTHCTFSGIHLARGSVL